MENYKELLIELYREYAPEKIDQIDFYLERYKGKEKQFYITQKAKYSNKKSVKDSKNPGRSYGTYKKAKHGS